MKCIICKKDIVKYQELVTRGDRSIFHSDCYVERYKGVVENKELLKLREANKTLRQELKSETENREYWNNKFNEIKEESENWKEGVDKFVKDNGEMIKEEVEKMDIKGDEQK